MPRYYFHVKDCNDLPDEEGTELSGPDEARIQAVRTSGEMLRDRHRRFWGSPYWQMHVTDVTGATVCLLRFTVEW